MINEAREKALENIKKATETFNKADQAFDKKPCTKTAIALSNARKELGWAKGALRALDTDSLESEAHWARLVEYAETMCRFNNI